MDKIKDRIAGLKRARFYADNLPFASSFVTKEELSISSDQWNSGSDHRIKIPAGVRVEIVNRLHREAEEIYGAEASEVQGLWAERFSTGWPSDFAESREVRIGFPDA